MAAEEEAADVEVEVDNVKHRSLMVYTLAIVTTYITTRLNGSNRIYFLVDA